MADNLDLSLGQRLRRLARHVLASSARTRRAFPPATLEAISAAIAAGERQHRGEVRLIVETALPAALAWHAVDNRSRARALFAQYGIWDTEDNCGVLVYVNLAERKVDIVADREIGRKVDAAQWQAVCATMTQGYARGQFHDSTLAAIEQVNTLLRQHFPANGARPNQLPDQPLVL